MRGVARESGRIRPEPRMPCGSWGLKIAPIPYEVPFSCGRWECDECRKKKIEKCQHILRDAQLVIYGYVSQRDPIKTFQDKKDFGYFLKRKVEGEYWWVLSDNRTVIISRCKHPDSERILAKEDIIFKLLPEVLNEEWVWWLKDRFGRSRKKKEEESVVLKDANTEEIKDAEVVEGNSKREYIKPFDYKTPLATWKKHNDPNKYKIIREINNIYTGCQMYRWLKNHLNDIYLEPRGKEFIEYFETPHSSEAQCRRHLTA